MHIKTIRLEVLILSSEYSGTKNSCKYMCSGQKKIDYGGSLQWVNKTEILLGFIHYIVLDTMHFASIIKHNRSR